MSTALVLAGGGAKGAYQATVATRIFDHLDLKAITGISVGALNGAVLSQNKPDSLMDFWQGTRREDIWQTSLFSAIKLAFGYKLGLYDPSPLKSRIDEAFNPNSTEIPFECGSVSLQTGEFVKRRVRADTLYGKEETERVRRFVLASSAIPGLVEPVRVSEERQLMVDGGIRDIAPISSALSYDPDRILIILNSDPSENFLKTEPIPENVYGLIRSALEIALNETLNSDIDTARKLNQTKKYRSVPIDVISPSEPLGSAIDFSKFEKRRKIGKKDAEAYLEQKA